MDQFATGFPAAGTLSPMHLFAATQPRGAAVDPRGLFETADALFRERTDKSGSRMIPIFGAHHSNKLRGGGYPRQWSSLIRAIRAVVRHTATTYHADLDWGKLLLSCGNFPI